MDELFRGPKFPVRELCAARALLLERLILELTITEEFVRLTIFLFQIMVVVVNLWTFYPADLINPVHMSLQKTLQLETLALTPTAEELFGFLEASVDRFREVTPNSALHVPDPQLRKLVVPDCVHRREPALRADAGGDPGAHDQAHGLDADQERTWRADRGARDEDRCWHRLPWVETPR